MKYQIIESSGAWVDKSSLKNGLTAKIINEVKKEPSKFVDEEGNPKMQDTAKVVFEGQKEPVNVALNRATVNALIEAFGEESNDWQNKILTVEVEKVRVAGKAVTALYLIPEGYKKIDDEDGYAKILPTSEVNDVDF